jgi:hypothetical protein
MYDRAQKAVRANSKHITAQRNASVDEEMGVKRRAEKEAKGTLTVVTLLLLMQSLPDTARFSTANGGGSLVPAAGLAAVAAGAVDGLSAASVNIGRSEERLFLNSSRVT